MSLGAVLVTGGCGFVGYHIVKHLLEDPLFSEVHVVSRNPTHNRLPGAVYHAGDITDVASLHALLTKVQPRTIIHTASPTAIDGHGDEKLLYTANVTGTLNLLRQAAALQTVQAFVYTSSVLVMAGRSFANITEDAPLLTKHSRGADAYSITKAIADRAVLIANDPSGMRTVCLRLPGMYGERDNQCIPGALSVMHEGKHRIQVGDNKVICDWCSVSNAATAHVLAAKALLDNSPNGPKVSGEAFFITDDAQLPFWTFMWLIWGATGDSTPRSQITVLPAWLVIGLATITEWLFWIFTFGRTKPKYFRRAIMEHSCLSRSYDIRKAKERLGYRPKKDMHENIAAGLAWAKKEEQEQEDRKKKGRGKKD